MKLYTQSNYDAQCKHTSQIQIQKIIDFASVDSTRTLMNSDLET